MEVGAVRGARHPGAEPAIGSLVVERGVALWGGNRVPAPHLVSGHRVVGGDVAADAVFAAGHSDDDVIADDERRVGDAVAIGGIGDFLVPENLAGLGIESDQVRVKGAHIEVGAAVNGHASIVRTATENRGAQLMLVAPEFLLRRQIVRDRRVVRGGDVHDAVGDDRGVLKRSKLADPGLEDHAGDQLGNVRGADAFEGGIPLIPVVPAVDCPIPLGGSRRGDTEKRRDNQPTQAILHRHSPLRIDRARM